MKKCAIPVLMLLICAVAVKPRANAQGIKVAVPHDFVAGGMLLHGGTYTFTRQSSEGVLRLSSVDRKESGMFILPTTFESEISDRTTLRFEIIGNLYILSAIQTPRAVYTFAPESKTLRIALKQSTASSAGQ
jgi:hypothetical protein